MANEQVRERWGTDWRRMLVAGLILLLPLLVVVLDFDAGVLAGCGGYGYGCSEPACFTVQISTNQGYTWQKGTAWVYGPPGSQIDLYVRTTMSTNVYQVEGWSFGVAHSAPTLEGSGGSLVLSAAAAGPDVQTVQGGAPPDFVSTRVWTCGLTQGLAIDMGATHITLGPRTNFVTAVACYRLKFPTGYAVHTATLAFSGEVGVPPVASIVTRQGQTLVPCKESLTLKIQPTSYYPTPSYCPLSPMEPDPCEGGEEGARVVRSGGPAPLRGADPCSVETVQTVLSDTDPLGAYPAITAIKLWPGEQEPPQDVDLEWTRNDYPLAREASWHAVNALPIGYGVAPLGLDLNNTPGIPPMQGNYTTFYVRIHFQLGLDAPRFDRFLHSTLEADLGVDDGFVAYLNGVEIRRMNALGDFRPPQETQVPVAHDARSDREHESPDRVSGYHDLHSYPPGSSQLDPNADNVLAIQVLNLAPQNPDCVLSPRLHVRKRGPFVVRASQETLADPTAFEVVARLPDDPLTPYEVRVDYTYMEGGVPRTEYSDFAIVKPQGTESVGTMYRVLVPGRMRQPGGGWIQNPPLPPDTSVEYRLSFFDGQVRRDFEPPLTMVTAPPPEEPLTFIALGNAGARGTSWGLPGVYQDPGQIQDQLSQVLADLGSQAHVQFHLVAGDMVIRNNVYQEGGPGPVPPQAASIEAAMSVEAADHRFYNPYSAVLCHTPFYVAPGEEDLEVRQSQFPDQVGIEYDGDYSAAYTMPIGRMTANRDSLTEQWYCFETGSAHVVVLRSSEFHEPNEVKVGGLIYSDQIVLLEKLRCSEKPWKIVVVHHPPYTTKRTDLDVDQAFDRDEFLVDLENTFGGFEAFGVDLVISAHEKLFEESRAVTAQVVDQQLTRTVVQQGPDFVEPGAPVYIVTGGGGERLWECEPGDPGCPEVQREGFTLAVERQHHVVRITADESLLTIQAIDAVGNEIAGTRSTILKGVPFKRADANADLEVNITDAIFALNYLFLGGDSPTCEDAADANDDGALNLTDPIFTLNHLFLGGQEPPAPGTNACGFDPTHDALGCRSYEGCPPLLRHERCRCADGEDNDQDGLTDCEDPDCTADPAYETCRCADFEDNDGDLAVDCADPDCCDDPECSIWDWECHCDDGVDNDLDGTVDCADPDCCDDFECTAFEACHCADEDDNDLDGFTDCDDPDCIAFEACHCDDQTDNDQDGLTDCDDPDCAQDPGC